MKKVLFMALASILLLAPISREQTTREETGVIVIADRADNYWEVVDNKGEAWAFTDGEDLDEGDLVRVKFDTLNTDSIYDDEIVSVYCIGYVENVEEFLK